MNEAAFAKPNIDEGSKIDNVDDLSVQLHAGFKIVDFDQAASHDGFAGLVSRIPRRLADGAN